MISSLVPCTVFPFGLLLPSDLGPMVRPPSYRHQVSSLNWPFPISKISHFGEQGWRSGERTRLPPMWPGLKSRRRHHMWFEFAVGSLPCSERFFSGYSGVPLSSKTNISKFQFDQESGRRRTTMWMCYLQIFIYLLFIYFIYFQGG